MSGKSESHGGGEDHGKGHKPHKKHHHHGHGAHEEHEEGWIVSFADNVLLMMGFFVILLAMNMGPKGSGPEEEGEASAAAAAPSDNMLDFAIAVREAFHNPVTMESTLAEDQPLIRRLKDRANMGKTDQPGPNGGDKYTQTVRPTDWSGKAGYVEFADHSSELTQTERTLIAEMAKEAAGTRWMVEVRGHASKLESWGDVKKARELSYQRAWATGQELFQNGVRWEQIRLVASGDHAPVTPRARTASEHMTNQRAEILIMPEMLPDDPHMQIAPGR